MTEPTVAGALSAASDQELIEFVRLCADFDWRNSEIQTRRSCASSSAGAVAPRTTRW